MWKILLKAVHQELTIVSEIGDRSDGYSTWDGLIIFVSENMSNHEPTVRLQKHTKTYTDKQADKYDSINAI